MSVIAKPRCARSSLYRKLPRALICLFFALFTTSAFCFPANVTVLNNREYFPAARNAISEAKKSIFVVMYLINFNKEDKNSSVTQLMEELLKAKRRGVDVKVILDYQKSAFGSSSGQPNLKAFDFLKNNGIKTYYDTLQSYTHAKAVVIDKKIIISGSHNWSCASLDSNNEASFLIDSPQSAARLLDDFSRIKLSASPLDSSPGAAVPYWAMVKGGVIPEMFRRHNERGLDIWLLLLRDFDGNPAGILDAGYEDLAGALGLLKSMDRPLYRREINRQLSGLNKLYKIIEADTAFGLPVKIKLLKKPGRESFNLPLSYWEYGWQDRLNMAAKVCLLINLAELGNNPRSPEWMLSRPQITEKYGIGQRALYAGMKMLRDFNIIDVKYGPVDKGYEDRMPPVIVFSGLYDMREFEQGIKRLEDSYNRDLIAKSREYAFVVFKGYDLSVIEQIAKFIGIYGEANVAEAFKIAGQKAPDNPKRTFGYVTGILGKMKKGAIGITEGGCP